MCELATYVPSDLDNMGPSPRALYLNCIQRFGVTPKPVKVSNDPVEMLRADLQNDFGIATQKRVLSLVADDIAATRQCQ